VGEPTVTDTTSQSITLDWDLSSAGAARRFVRAELEDRVPIEVVADLQLVASELVTNAVEHGVPGAITMSISLSESAAAISVTSYGNDVTLLQSAGSFMPRSDLRSGRGLAIVRRITDQLDIATLQGMTTVTAHRRYL
jgi:anti-sigma regulatory factor (Ser/Thr protein kinase)